MKDKRKFFIGLRRTLGMVFLAGITLLFIDFTGTAQGWLGWMARIQFLPALLALNAAVVIALVALTLVAGRIYCSVICPLGVMQDVVSRCSGLRRKKKYRFSYSPEVKWLRYGMFAVFVAALAAGVGSVVALLAPYSSFGRIVSGLVWHRTLPVFIIALVTFVILFILAWRNGRTYCNTVCPVGTVLGFLSRFSLFRITIDESKCNKCGLCSRRCKAACIDGKGNKVDYSRCVMCLDCLSTCTHDAISYTRRRPGAEKGSPATAPDVARRTFLSAAAVVAAGAAIKAEEKIVDGGLAIIEDKKIPARATPIVPAGAQGLRHMARHCTACQLCVTVCPDGVLRPSGRLESLMQPELSYESGYCRPVCTRCSDVCPAGAIMRITPADKSAIQIGHAVWVRDNCVVLTDGVQCGNCARHCPAGAIQMIPSVPGDENSPRIPMVNTERCTGCGACENLCPARPFSAIYVEGHERHRTI